MGTAAHANGKPKGHSKMNGQPNGGTSTAPRRARRKQKSSSYLGWIADKGLKVGVWYLIITLAFRCPKTSNDLTDASPKICKPSLQAKEFVHPYVDPYYQQYVAPYVQRAQPYVDQVTESVYKPGLAAYEQYGAPRVTQAQEYSQQQWEKIIKPQLEVAREHAGKQYDASLAPHVKKVQDVVQPYYDQVSTSASDILELEVKPAYRKTAPYAQRVYSQGQEFAVKTALPQAQYASNTVWTLWTRQVWPRLRVLYGENVEPQLNRITERLGRYKDGKRLEAEIKSMESESKAAEASSKVDSIASSVSSTFTEATDNPTSAATAPAEPESTITPTEQFREDLKSWEAICSKAVNEGAEDLKERIQDISTRQTSSQAEGVGNSLVIQLEETAIGALNSVKARTQQVVAAIPDDADDARLEDASEELTLGIRAAGQSVKARAQAVREWHTSYNNEIDSLVSKALESTLETIDGIRELRLSEIGRRYADKELPHKEWARYNDLKKATQTWRDDVEKIVQGDKSIKAAKDAGDEVESRGMNVAEETAKELGRLKEVALWKVKAGDASDDFNTKHVPPVAERARQQVVEKAQDAKEAIMGEEQGTVESATSVAAESVQSVASDASASASSVSSRATEATSSVSNQAAEAVNPPPASSASSSAQSVSDHAAEAVAGSGSSSLYDTATDATSAISESILGSETPSVAGSLGPKAQSILDAGNAKKEAASSTVSSAGSEASSALNDAYEEASSTGRKVFAGANAQVLVEAREPILDSDIVDTDATYSERVQSMFDGAMDQAAALTEAVADALKGATSTQGTVESVTSVASEQYESALAAASSVLFGTGSGAVEGGSNVVREQYESAVTA